jgi:GNAT superfamily N-acetyltransferase
MKVSPVERALHDRTRLAFAAAAAAGLPGRFIVSDEDGLFGALTTAAELGFLNSVSGTTDDTVGGLPSLLARFAAAGAPAPSLKILEPSVAVAEAARHLGYVLISVSPVAATGLPSSFGPGRGRDELRPSPIRVTETQPGAPDHERFFAVLAEGYAAQGAVNAFIAAEHRSAGLRRFLAWRHGHPVGAAAFSSHGGTIVLGGAATIPAARGTGVQSALLRHRLTIATQEGYTDAVATAGPDTPSARNLARAGFVILARQRWERPITSA